MQNYFINRSGLYNSENEHDSCGIGFVASIKGNASHDIVKRGLEVLVNMTHRGAESSDNVSGDGAGILIQLPHNFFKTKIPNIPSPGNYGAGLLFLPKNPADREACENILFSLIKQENLEIISTQIGRAHV